VADLWLGGDGDGACYPRATASGGVRPSSSADSFCFFGFLLSVVNSFVSPVQSALLRCYWNFCWQMLDRPSFI
jgi:hypothetical protein